MILKAGVFVDTENVNRCGGWTMRYDVLKAFDAAQGARLVRANAYMAAVRASPRAARSEMVEYTTPKRALTAEIAAQILSERKFARNFRPSKSSKCWLKSAR